MKNILIICNENIVRMVCTEGFLWNIVKENNMDAVVKSAVLSTFGARQLKIEMLKTSDVIFAVDKKVYDELFSFYADTISGKRVINLDILDVYNEFGDYDSFLIADKTEKMSTKELNLFINRPEIRHKLTLREVLNIKKHLILEIILSII